jgi:DNA-binding response OmpR family regulator
VVTRVLVVDDEPDILLMLRLALEGAGFDVVLAADGEQALERVDDERPDVILLDVMMPVLDGWGVLRRLTTFLDPPPVVVVSARSSPADVEQAVSLGADDYVPKPFHNADLIERVRTAITRTETERRAHREALLEAAGN